MRSPDANLFPSMTLAVWLATLPVKPAALGWWAVRGIVLQTVYRKEVRREP